MSTGLCCAHSGRRNTITLSVVSFVVQDMKAIMGRTALALLLLAFSVAGLAMTALAQQDDPPSDDASLPAVEAPRAQPEPTMTACKPDRILVKVQPGVDAAAVVARYGGTILRTIPGIDVHVVNVPAGQGQQAIDALNADPEVEYAEADQIVTASQAGPGC